MNDLANPSAWLTEKPIQYSQHPAFLAYQSSRSDLDDLILKECQVLSHEIEVLEKSLSYNHLSLHDALYTVLPKLAKVFTHLNEINKSQIPKAQEFLTSVWQQTIRIIADDLAYFERRNSLQPVVSNQNELNMHWLLEQQGFFTCRIPQEIIHNLRQSLQPWMETIKSRADQGFNSREELSINQIPHEIVQYLNQQFEAIGINSAIRSTRRENCTLSGFALELSVPHANWWQSDYQDLGYEAGRCSYFHFDEARDVYKAILYLSDVPSPDYGATGCLPQTFSMQRDRLPWILSRSLHLADRSLYSDIGTTGRLISSPTFRRHFMMMPEYLRENSHWGFDLLDDLPNSQEVANSEMKILGDAGTCLVFDGSRLVHRGGLVRSGHRWALQIIFGVDRRNAETAAANSPKTFQDVHFQPILERILF